MHTVRATLDINVLKKSFLVMKGSTGNKLIFVIFLIVEDRNLISFIASTIF